MGLPPSAPVQAIEMVYLGVSMSWSVHISLVLGLASVCAVAADAPPLLAVCAECHGVDGISRKPGVPHIDGQPMDVISAMLETFRTGDRSSAVAAHRTPVGEVQDVAAHFSQQKAQRPPQSAAPALLARGNEIYEARCDACHLDAGRQSDKNAPLLAGQDQAYLASQMRAFQRGERKFPFMMDEAYRNLTDHDFEAVASFYATQPQRLEARRKRRRDG